MMKEVNEIQTTTKLPSNLPKVVYVYTTHNDFWEEIMLHNMQQTYQNIEYWISDGSSDKEKIKEIKAFCKKYNVNYHSLKRPSVNKADNLNHFLKYAKVNFDYLLIADFDVIIDKNFVKKLPKQLPIIKKRKRQINYVKYINISEK
ncbi:glycosyltransferase [Metamycoplasma sualvi]|uniref:glycosyltransferase n=1 Tax=Metamycoplasma sualvi TaxID=2125 RepID=UPI00387396D0